MHSSDAKESQAPLNSTAATLPLPTCQTAGWGWVGRGSQLLSGKPQTKEEVGEEEEEAKAETAGERIFSKSIIS